MFKKHKTIFLTVFLVMVCLFMLSGNIYAENLANWPYKLPLAIGNAPLDEGSPTAAIDNGIFVFGPIDTATLISQNKMKPNCSDFRVADANGNVKFHLTYDCNSSSTYVYAKDSVASNTAKQLYLYHGNMEATGLSLDSVCTNAPELCTNYPTNHYPNHFSTNWAKLWEDTNLLSRLGCSFDAPANFDPKFFYSGTEDVRNIAQTKRAVYAKTFYFMNGNYFMPTANMSNTAGRAEVTMKFYDAMTGELIGCDDAYCTVQSCLDNQDDRGWIKFTNTTPRYITVLYYVNYTTDNSSSPRVTDTLQFSNALYHAKTNNAITGKTATAYLPVFASTNIPATFNAVSPTAATAVATREDNANVSYRWFIEGGTSNPVDTSNVNITFTTTGTKAIKIKAYPTELNQSYGVYYTTSVEVVNPIQSVSVVCPENASIEQPVTCSVNAIKDGNLSYQYTWTVDGGTITQNNGSSIQVKWSTLGQKTVGVTMQVVGYASLNKSAQQNLNVVVDFTFTSITCPSTLKMGQLGNCTANASTYYGTLKYKWTIIDGVANQPNNASTGVFFTKSGSKIVTAEVSLNEDPSVKKTKSVLVTVEPVNFTLNISCPASVNRLELFECSATGSTDWGNVLFEWSTDTGGLIASADGLTATAVFSQRGQKYVKIKMYLVENTSFYLEKIADISVIVPPPVINVAECTQRVYLGQRITCSANATSDDGTPTYNWASDGVTPENISNGIKGFTFKTAGQKNIRLTVSLSEYPEVAATRDFTVTVLDNSFSMTFVCPEKAVTDTTFVCSATATEPNYGTVSYKFNVTGGSSQQSGNTISIKPSNNQSQVSVTATAYLTGAEWLAKTETKIIPVTSKSYLTPTVSGNKVTYIGIENTYTATAPCLAKNECSIKFTVNDVEVENSTASFVFATQGRHVIKAIATMGETSVETNYPVFANALPKVYVTIEGPTGAFVGKAETYSVKIPDKYEGLTIRGQWILPNGSTSDSETLEFTPTAKEKTFIKYTAWVDGFKELTEATTSKTVFVNDYVFPKPVIYAQKTTGVAPLTLVFKTSFTEKFVSGAIYRINYKWEIFQGSEIIDTIQTDKSYIVYKFEKTGNYTVKLTATDQYDNSSTDQISVYAALATVEVTLKESVNNKGYRAPLKVYIKPSTTGNKSIADKLLSHEWKINNNTISDTRPHYLMATLPDPGDYTITYTATYSSGLVATGSKTITVNPNRLPTCDISATANSAKTYLALKAQCTDPDGRMASYKWDLGDGRGYVNGTGMMSRKITSGETITIKLYACDDAQGCVEVTKEVTP